MGLLKIIRGLFIIPAYLILLVGFIITPDTTCQTFYDWLVKYAYIDFTPNNQN